MSMIRPTPTYQNTVINSVVCGKRALYRKWSDQRSRNHFIIQPIRLLNQIKRPPIPTIRIISKNQNRWVKLKVRRLQRQQHQQQPLYQTTRTRSDRDCASYCDRNYMQRVNKRRSPLHTLKS